MELRLIREPHGRPTEKGIALDQVSLEAEFRREQRVPFEPRRFVRDVLVLRGEQVARHLAPGAVDSKLRRQVPDLLDGQPPRLPQRARRILADFRGEFAEARIGHMRQVRSGVRGFSSADALLVDHGDAAASLLEQIRGRNAGDARAHDKHVHVVISPQDGKLLDAEVVVPKGVLFHQSERNLSSRGSRP